MEKMTVAKFGGSVLGASGSAIPAILERLSELSKSSKVVAVFSAPPVMHDSRLVSLTDIVLGCGEAIEQGQEYDTKPVHRAYDELLKTQSQKVQEMCKPIVDAYLSKFTGALAEAVKRKSFVDEVRANALAYSGELLMSSIMANIINENDMNAKSIDFEEWPIITDNNVESANFVRNASEKALGPLEKLVKDNDVVTIGGFVGRSDNGTMTTYERGGSDRTAADIGILFNKKYDVIIDLEKANSVASADPRIVKSTEKISTLSYNEARIAGMFGMKILDPIAIKEIHEQDMDIPVTVTNMHDPSDITSVSRRAAQAEGNPLKIVTGKKNCAILKIESAAAIDLLSGLKHERRYEEFIVLSPYTRSGIEYARILFLDAMYVKRNDRYMKKFDPFCTITDGRGVITLIGDQMSRAQHIVAKVSTSIGDAGLNILNMDAQEETSRIIVIVEDAGDNIERAIASIHEMRKSLY